MLLGKKIIGILSIIIIITLLNCKTHGKSVYVIIDRSNTVRAYKIIGEQIEEQTDVKNLPNRGDAVGLGRGSGFNESLYTAAPTEQLEREPEPQPYHTTQELIDWLEGILADGQITNEEGVWKVIESLKEQL